MWRNVSIALAAGLAVLAGATVAHAGNRGKVLKPDELKRISEAMPAKAPAKPAKPRKVLVYSKCSGFYHGSIPYGNAAFEIMGKKTGAFEAVVSDDLANFEADKLKQFDAIIINNCTGELLMARPPRKPRAPNAKRIKDPAKLQQAQERYKKALARYEEDLAKFKAEPKADTEKLRKNLMDWVKAGHGVIGSHAATDCSYKWKEYGAMMGGYFAGHPWHMKVGIRNDDPTSPVNAAFGGKNFEITDEIYQFNRGVYSRYRQRTLLSLDMTKTPKKGARKDQDFAVSWVKTHGEGRVFYCSLGHRNEIFWNPQILQHYLAGIQWALGDLKGVETKPNPLPESEKPAETGK